MSDRASQPPPGPDHPPRATVADSIVEHRVARSGADLTETPLVPSRALGRLLGLESLLFKVESCQPSGSWLDRSARELVAAAVNEGQTGLCAVGLDVWTLPLAIRCAQVGLRFVVLEPIIPALEAGRPGAARIGRALERSWLSTLGTHTLAVDADLPTLQEAAQSDVARSGLYLVLPENALLQAGLSTLVRQLDRAGGTDLLLAVPGLTGRERAWLAASPRSAAVPLPLADVPGALAGRPFAVVGTLTSSVAGGSACAEEDDASSVLAVAVSPREADAVRRLLAREEGLLVSQRGGAGLAGLVRALREDRARRPRERRLKQVTSAVVVLTGDPLRAGGEPPPEPDSVQRRPVSLDALEAGLARLLVTPPGR